jgi:virginiamycin B lyase
MRAATVPTPNRRPVLIAVAVVAVAATVGIWVLSRSDGSTAAAPAPSIAAPVQVPATTSTITPVRTGRVTTWQVPEALVGLRGVAVAPDGTVWVTEQNRGQVDALVGNRLTRYHVEHVFPDAGAFGFGWGPGGALWFTGYPGGTLGRVMPDRAINLFEGRSDSATTLGIAQGPDGSMWATDPNLGSLVRIAADGTLSPVIVSHDGGQTQRPGFVVDGGDGNMWFTIPDTSQVASVPATGDPTVTRYTVPGHVTPRNIVAAGDGTLWVSLEDRPALAHVDEATGHVTIVPLTGVKIPTDGLNDLALAKDGTLWVTTPSATVVHVDPANGRVIEETKIPGALYADGITVAGDGSVWVAARDDLIARIAP